MLTNQRMPHLPAWDDIYGDSELGELSTDWFDNSWRITSIAQEIYEMIYSEILHSKGTSIDTK